MGTTIDRVAEGYRRFARVEAKGVSDVYYDWASAIAEDREVSALIAGLPGIKVQPNLVFAAARYAGAPVGPYPPFRDWLLENWAAVESVVLTRATQTNEAARCAVLLPVLSRLDRPLALIEAGASAGLCLFPDRYSYAYDADGRTVSLDPTDGPSAVAIPCTIDRRSVPTALPRVIHRSGVDLNPLDVTDDQQMLARDDVTWISNEGPGVFPFITDQVTEPIDGRTIVAVDGVPVALVGPHGQSYESLG